MFCWGKYYLSRAVNLTDMLKIPVYRNIHYLYIGCIYSYEIMVLLCINWILFIRKFIYINSRKFCLFGCLCVCLLISLLAIARKIYLTQMSENLIKKRENHVRAQQCSDSGAQQWIFSGLFYFQGAIRVFPRSCKFAGKFHPLIKAN